MTRRKEIKDWMLNAGERSRDNAMLYCEYATFRAENDLRSFFADQLHDALGEELTRVPWVDDVAAFHRAGDQPIEKEPVDMFDRGAQMNTLRDLRVRLLTEEFNEYLAGEKEHDIVEIADALGDMIYVIIGTAHAYGIPIERVFAEIQRSNMTKVVNGKVLRSPLGKILKPDTYSPPNITEALWPGPMPGDKFEGRPGAL